MKLEEVIKCLLCEEHDSLDNYKTKKTIAYLV